MPPSNDRTLASLHRQQLTLWLEEWRIEQILRSASISEPQQDSETRPAHLHKDTPRAGDIRLLFPAKCDDKIDRPVYVAVLEPRRDNRFLIAPFGRFSEPASPGEWRTGMKQLPLRVLCLWNSHVVEESVLRRSWRAGNMLKSKIAKALEVYRHHRTGTPLPTVTPDQVGPPLFHPLDPRLKYEVEESEIVAAHLVSPSQTVEYEISPSELRLAAEPRRRYGRRRRNGKKEQE